ncbi:acetoin pyruvate dehydrogenase complex, E3 component, dihydrolipoamide dehydrogenase [Agrilactobacillus composti DSM 18527 = JCM 14202]|uniref:Dihydrolipoyl dehydrogenase n=1 Tax=Agrilactobacillus composti DSM 18527 = JCM 14202 TaxID=1423734 RepID=X0PCS2_9LACO|nr:dihydrolipoyl dehydrogenase [Agrilactobacillus composti]KRM33114.1 acetoin pyruvate dehydrogenase complex, E3 component, dihydrolipoamide dehydrogenase [Agrilactobacillus composti DSM 18527 = JCM 14202]GAF38529.1 dihydrolipoamide dehydrogenase of branched-chain alpha-keto acid dehydrogenase [Agrilactobacillus composti DSM 18527 = JCM 14202]
MDTYYDVVVLGGGVGGYTAAIQAAKHHLKVALIEARLLGGVCLNQGCIPTKAYLKSAAVLRDVQRAADFGVEASAQGFDFGTIFDRKEKIVDQLRQGVAYLMQKNAITVFEGMGKILSPRQIQVTTGDKVATLDFRNLIIATGATAKTLPDLLIDGTRLVTSQELLAQDYLPASLVVIGGGAIGLEWASLLNDFGVQVQVLEYADQLLANETKAISKALKAALSKRGIQITTGAQVTSSEIEDQSVMIRYTDAKGAAQTAIAEQALVAVGRQARVTGFGLDNTDVILTTKNTIAVDAHYETNVSNIFAIGDCIDTLQLAHVAMAEGIHAADFIAGLDVEPIDYDQVPRCIYTYPEVAVVGPANIDTDQHPHVKTGVFPYQANGKALIEGESAGNVQVAIDGDTDDLLQVLIVGEHATDMISEASLGLYLNASAAEVAATIHPHPTLSETIRQATLAAKGLATDI